MLKHRPFEHILVAQSPFEREPPKPLILNLRKPERERARFGLPHCRLLHGRLDDLLHAALRHFGWARRAFALDKTVEDWAGFGLRHGRAPVRSCLWAYGVA